MRKAPDELDGVEWSKVDRSAGRVEVAYEEDRAMAEKLHGAVEEAGYTLQRQATGSR